ncbi:MAG: hypothetical protein MUO85_00540 [candidate division Zixibacteria bacterium]|nr:hypothetical protein [candidate division Zixibacteria bacterium]
MKKPGGEKEIGQKKRTRELDEKMKESKETESGEESEGVAEGVLGGLGQIIPGLGGLLKGLKKSSAFKERLKKVNQEIERKLKETPLKRTQDRVPRIEGNFSARTLVQPQGTDFVEESSFKKNVKKSPAPLIKPKEPMVDVFDEGDHLRIITELVGVKEEDIKTDLEKNTLTIKINSAGWKSKNEVALPYAPKGKLRKVFRNGFLEISIGKG